jgi:hypothetical protein
MSAPAPDGAQDPEPLSMHYGITGSISASVGAKYPDRLSMLCSAQTVWSVPLQPHDQSWWRVRSVRVPYIKYMACRKNKTTWRCKTLTSKYKQSCAAPINSGIVATRGPTACVYRLHCCSTIASAVEGYITAENHISAIRLLDVCSRPGEKCFIEKFIKCI